MESKVNTKPKVSKRRLRQLPTASVAMVTQSNLTQLTPTSVVKGVITFDKSITYIQDALANDLLISESRIREIFQTYCIHKITRAVNTSIQSGFNSFQHIISTEGTGISVIVFPNRQSQSFTETIVKNYLTDEIREYDVSSKGIVCDETGKAGEVCSECKMKVFTRVMEELPFAHLKHWLRYQVDIRNNKLLFLEELQGVLMDNEEYFKQNGKNRFDQISSIVSNWIKANFIEENEELTKLRKENIELKEKIGELTLPDYYWDGDPVELLELVVAIGAAKKVKDHNGTLQRNKFTKFLERVFNTEIRNYDSLLDYLKRRDKKIPVKNPLFLDELIKSYQVWLNTKMEK